MKPFYKSDQVRMPRVKQLARWVKKYAKYGAYMEVIEVPEKMRTKDRADQINDLEKYTVQIFCPKLHTDKMGNTAIKP